MYEHIVRGVFEEPWAILPAKLAVIAELVRFRASGGRLTEEEIRASIGAAAVRPVARQAGAVAVIPVFGVLAQRMNMLLAMSGGTSTEQLTGAFRQAVADESIKAVVLNVDSPGGSVYGIDELASEMFASRGRKPIIAQANSLMASAAYYLASAADEIVVTPTGEVGSIGVLAAHSQVSNDLERDREQVTVVSAGRYKGENNPFIALSDEARANLQAKVDRYYGMFVAAVARGRGVKPAEVRSGFGEGRVVGAREAVRLGMADRVATLDQTLARLGAGPGPSARAGDGAVAVLEEPPVIDEAIPSDTTAGEDLDRRRRRFRMRSQ